MDPDEIKKQFPAAIEYLTEMYLIARDYKRITNAHLAEWMNVSRSAVTQAVARMKKLGLVEQNPYESIEITDAGRQLAITFLRRHYLIEHLLVRILGFPWHKADEEAKQLQSVISEDLTEYLYKHLGEPHSCPHGNPFPEDPRGAMLLQAVPITEGREGDTHLVVRVTEEGEALPGMLLYCYKNRIEPGSKMKILEKHIPESGAGSNGAAETTSTTDGGAYVKVLVTPRRRGQVDSEFPDFKGARVIPVEADPDLPQEPHELEIPYNFARHIRYKPA